MAGQRAQVDETGEVAQIAVMIERAGIRLSGAELAALVEPYRRNRVAIDAIRGELGLAEEPAITFEA